MSKNHGYSNTSGRSEVNHAADLDNTYLVPPDPNFLRPQDSCQPLTSAGVRRSAPPRPENSFLSDHSSFESPPFDIASQNAQQFDDRSLRSQFPESVNMNSPPQSSGRSHRGRHDPATREPRRRRHRRHHSAARYSTSRSPLRGSSRRHSIPHSRSVRSPGANSTAAAAAAPKSPFHAGLQDILRGVFGHGERGPTPEEMQKLADDFGDLIIGELLDRLVAELRQGLLERLLIEYLEEMVAGAVRKKMGRKGKGQDSGFTKGLLKKAAMLLVKRFTHHQ